ncbi:fumarate hydratase [Candidatus Magnetominusculus dajiuhuensis]|uniref:fumarate hydratase n=1 Tax=Candidatus Magnetominusculus dajiuhuensis TaxID=3137712 RepID=UPI003B4327F3
MLKLIDGIVELYKKVASSVPPDVERAIAGACEAEPAESPGRGALALLVERMRAARAAKMPVCRDAGIPVFWIKIPRGLSQNEIGGIVIEGTKAAAKKISFHAEGVLESLMGGPAPVEGYPIIYFEESEGTSLVIDLLLNGADCENAGRLFTLTEGGLTAGGVILPHGYDAIAGCIEEAVAGAEGKVCFPLIAAVGVGSSREQVAALSKRQLMRKLNGSTSQENSPVHEFEGKVLTNINGSANNHGLRTALIGVKMAVAPIHPASLFVDVTISCWALRRGRLIWS